MSNTVGISATTGQTVIIAAQVLDGYQERTDGYTPTVDFVLNPSGTEMSGYPANMSRLSEGLYNSSISIPSGLANEGTYLASVSWTDPDSGRTRYQIFLINAARPFGIATASPA